MSTRARIGLLAAGLLLLSLLRPGLPLSLNSDGLYLDDLWLSLSQGAGLGRWYLPPAPSFFPDLGFVALLSPAQDLATRHGLYGLVFLFVLAAGAAWLGRRRFGLAWDEAWACGLGGALLAGVGLAWAQPLHDLLVPAHHGAALLGGLALLALAPGAGQEARAGAKLSAALLTALLGFSDKLYILWAVLPLLLTQASQPRLFWRRPCLNWWAWVAGGWLAAELALSRLRGMEPPSVARVRWEFWLQERGGQDLGPLLGESGDLILACGALGALALAWLGWRAWRLWRPGSEAAPAAEALAWSALSGVVSLALAAALGKMLGRYSYPFFVLPALLLPLALPRRRELLALAACAGLAVALLSAALRDELHAWSVEYPADALLLDTSLAGRGLGAGVADYWQARRLRLTAHSHPRLLPVKLIPEQGKLAPYLWIVDGSIFSAEGGTFPAVDYVLCDGLDKDDLRRILGPPKRTAMTGDHELWIYR